MKQKHILAVYLRNKTSNLNFETMTKKAQIVQTQDLNELMFHVEKVEATDYSCNSDYAFDIFAYPDDVKTRVNSCSDRYELVPVSDFAPHIRQIIMNKGLEFTENYRMINNAVFYGEIIIEDDRFYVGKPEDHLNMRLTWWHSINGLEKYALNLGTWERYLCTNGLWMTRYDTEKYGLSIGGKHTIKIRQSLMALENKLDFVLNNDVMLKALETYQPLYDNWVAKWEDRLEEVMKVASIGTTKNNVDIISSRIRFEQSELNYGNKVNDWLIYNGINRFLFDDANNVAFESARVRTDRKVLETLLNG